MIIEGTGESRKKALDDAIMQATETILHGNYFAACCRPHYAHPVHFSFEIKHESCRVKLPYTTHEDSYARNKETYEEYTIQISIDEETIGCDSNG